MIKRITLTGSTLRPRSIAVKAQLARALEDQVWPLLSNGAIRPVIETVFPLEKAADAHRLMEEGSHIGKILLTV
jgi:NADPH:quinone reductase-like Zn-dependent oxidoreductase